MLRIGGLAALGIGLPQLWQGRATAARKQHKAKNCIVLFLAGGPAQHSTWDPKPDAPEEIRGNFVIRATAIPGVHFGELLPKLATQAGHLCVLRGVATGDNAHSSSGYAMLTGVPHNPLNVENANPGPPNDAPYVGAILRRLRGDQNGLAAAVRLPIHIHNTDQSIWPGQDGGMLGRTADPWLFRCKPADANFHIPELSLPEDLGPARLSSRSDLLAKLDRNIAVATTHAEPGHRFMAQALNVLGSEQARRAFALNKEESRTRDRYGRTEFGQSCLLARRLIEAGVGLVHVNWTADPEHIPGADPDAWDTHTNETHRLKTHLCPIFDAAASALLDDLQQRGLLEETLVVMLTEFGRTAKFNPNGGREHWGHAFSIAMAGGGVRGGMVHGKTDRHAATILEGLVKPADITATMLHLLGHKPDAEVIDQQGRPFPASRGEVINAIL